MAQDKVDLDALVEDLEHKGQELLGKAADLARERPHVAVGIALGVGWVLGNGLPPRFAMAAARMGVRAFAGQLFAGGALARAIGEVIKGTGADDSPRQRTAHSGERVSEKNT